MIGSVGSLPPMERPCYSTTVDQSRWIVALLAALSAGGLLLGCDTHDIGRPCDPLLGDADPAVAATGRQERTETLTVVGQDVCLPCDELICVAADGKPGYCSKKCEDDSDCPTGFGCRVLIEPDEDAAWDDDHQFFAGSRFCTWLHCQSDEDCGAPGALECKTVPDSDPIEELEFKICEYAEDNYTDVERPACERSE